MHVELIVVGGTNDGQAIPVREDKFFIGRADDCQLKPKSDLVSRHHCVVLVEDAYMAVRDFGSKNGTFVNGEQVIGEMELKTGDRSAVGQLELEVRVAAKVGGEKKPRVKSIQEAVARTVESASESTSEDDKDLDLAWMNGEDDDSYDSSEETRTLDLAQSGYETTPSNSAADETIQTEPKKEEKKPERKIPKRSAATSGDAAADVLKNFFRGR